MSTFAATVMPTPYGFFDSDVDFQSEADGIVTFVKRKMGDDILSVELTRKEIWACLEEATLEYSNQINQMQTKSDLAQVLGQPLSQSSYTNKYPRRTLEWLNRQAEPYAGYSDVGGSYDYKLAYINLVAGRQDYNLYTDLIDPATLQSVSSSMSPGLRGKLRIIEIMHFSPLAAQHFLLNASNITNFLATNFNYESYVNSTVFYVLPIFEDVLRRGMLDAAFRLRRSHYSYDIKGPHLRIYPIPSSDLQVGQLWVKVSFPPNPLSPSFTDDSVSGVSGPQNAPFGIIPFSSITSSGRQWIRQYCLALCTTLLGLNRSKFKNIPIPNAELQLNGEELRSQGREDAQRLIEQIREFLNDMTHDKIAEREAAKARSIQDQLKLVPMPRGTSIIIG
jgi:hypothetical protein